MHADLKPASSVASETASTAMTPAAAAASATVPRASWTVSETAAPWTCQPRPVRRLLQHRKLAAESIPAASASATMLVSYAGRPAFDSATRRSTSRCWTSAPPRAPSRSTESVPARTASSTAASVRAEVTGGSRTQSGVGASAEILQKSFRGRQDSTGPVRSATILSAPLRSISAGLADGSTRSQERIFQGFSMVNKDGEPILNFLPLAYFQPARRVLAFVIGAGRDRTGISSLGGNGKGGRQGEGGQCSWPGLPALDARPGAPSGCSACNDASSG